MPARTQNHHHRQIHAPAEKANRARRRARAARVAAKAEPESEARRKLGQTTAGLARIVGLIKPSSAGASRCSGQVGLVLINLEQQSKKTGVFRQSVEHWDGLKVW